MGYRLGTKYYEGRCVDKKTVNEIVDKIKNQFKIKRCIFIGDRDLISKENLDVLEKDMDSEGFESILALCNRRNREVKDMMLGRGALRYHRLSDDLEYSEVVREGGLRFIVCRNPKVMERQKREREEDMEKIEKSLNELFCLCFGIYD